METVRPDSENETFIVVSLARDTEQPRWIPEVALVYKLYPKKYAKKCLEHILGPKELYGIIIFLLGEGKGKTRSRARARVRVPPPSPRGNIEFSGSDFLSEPAYLYEPRTLKLVVRSVKRTFPCSVSSFCSKFAEILILPD